MRILITGGSGFIGTHLITRLVALQHDIINFDKVPSTVFPDLSIEGDVRSIPALESALEGVDMVIHLAAEHKDNIKPTSLYFDVNVLGAKNLTSACERRGVKRIIFTSTVAVYGLHLMNATEETDLNPFNDYGKSKHQAELVFKEWYRGIENVGGSLLILRPTVVFGPGNRGNVYNLMSQVAANRFAMVGNGKNVKSLAYVENLIEFIVTSLSLTGEYVINYAEKPDLTMEALISQIRIALGKTPEFYHIPYWVGLLGGSVFDLLSWMMGREYSISSIRIKKFCASSAISTARYEALSTGSLIPLEEAISRTIKTEFMPE